MIKVIRFRKGDLMACYTIWIASSPGYPHSRAFDEVAYCLSCAFAKLGNQVSIVRRCEDIKGVPIVLGCNLLPYLRDIRLPQNAILYNLEQVQLNSPWMNDRYLELLRGHEVWDYSESNMEELRKLGVKNIKLCRIGYVPELTRMQPVEETTDVLFYGALNPRRRDILLEIERRGFAVTQLRDIYGEERDRHIAKSKIVLNLHFYESRVFEIVRVFYLLANNRFVVSEPGSDRALEKPFIGGLVFARREELVEVCAKYLKADKLRQKVAEKGFRQIQSLDQVKFLQEALANGKLLPRAAS